MKSVMASTGVTKELLDRECVDQDLCEIAEYAVDYKDYGPKLGLTSTAITVQEKNPNNSHSVMHITAAVFELWHRKKGALATYYKLAEMFLKCNNRFAAEKVCRMIKANAQGTSYSYIVYK